MLALQNQGLAITNIVGDLHIVGINQKFYFI